MNLIEQHIDAISEICRKHQVKELYAFGSVLDENRFRPDSDVDLIVRFEESLPVEKYFDFYFDCVESLEKMFGRRVDLMINSTIRNKYLRENIEETKELVYAA
ncbi:MAG: nucleotidyltransferase domain-containing protein [Bacteroidota bacterium]|nr:nucleotidyltransferase domain-containing protein [Bacteroidota bacterium]